jgi:hypothetical protein
MSRWQRPTHTRSAEAALFALRLVVLVLALALLTAGVASLAAQTQTPVVQDDVPTDAEVYSKLKPKILSETRSGDTLNTVIQIPAGADTFVTSGLADTNWSNDPTLRLGYNQSGGYGAQRIYLFFDVGAFIPANAQINSAILEGYQFAFAPGGDVPMPTELRHLNSTWDSAQLTWNNHQPDWGGVAGEGNIPPIVGYVQGNITDLVRQWVNGTRTNYGVILIGDERPQDRERIFHSLNANNGLFPRLTIDFNQNVDNTPPVATVQALPQHSPAQFQVSWTGTDAGGSGIASYDVRYRVQGGPWIDWKFQTTGTSDTFNGGLNGMRYDFVARARDNAGNLQAWSNVPQAMTTVDSAPPNATVNPLPSFTFTTSFVVTWTGTDNLSGIVHYDVQYSANNGPWITWLSQTTTTSAQFAGQDGSTYAFRARATDGVGNVQAFPGVGQTATTISINPPRASITPFSPKITNQSTFTVRWTGQASPGASIVGYDVEYQRNNGQWQPWLNNVNITSSSFAATGGDALYEFRVRARDNLGRTGNFVGPWPGNQIIVDQNPPFIVPQLTLPAVFR